jgi:radical SAM protein with 4Fe4S-binding SPASM domain
MPFTTMAVRSNGDVSPCCVDFIGGTNIGNINEKNLEEIWNSSKWHDFMKMQIQGRKYENLSCSSCSFYMNDYYIKDNVDSFPAEKIK